VAIAYALDFCLLIVLIVVVVVERRRTVRLIGHYLSMYAQTGLVTAEDVRMLGRLSGRRAARHWARMMGGPRAARAMGDYQLAATELALLHKRAERGVVEPAWFEWRRGALLQLMAAARQAFLRTPPRSAPPWAGQGPSGFRASGR
jgi:protease PrsW